VLQKVEGSKFHSIEQPPVNPLENEMVLELVKRHMLLYQLVQSLLAKPLD
jgi:hypothetical protein